MSVELLLAVLSITVLVLSIACFMLASERTHWKTQYETLRNEMLAQGQNSSRRIIKNLRGLCDEVEITLDEFIDTQG